MTSLVSTEAETRPPGEWIALARGETQDVFFWRLAGPAGARHIAVVC